MRFLGKRERFLRFWTTICGVQIVVFRGQIVVFGVQIVVFWGQIVVLNEKEKNDLRAGKIRKIFYHRAGREQRRGEDRKREVQIVESIVKQVAG